VQKKAERVAQVVEHLPSKCQVLPKREERERERERERELNQSLRVNLVFTCKDIPSNFVLICFL
jgi:hypothetical protein